MLELAAGSDYWQELQFLVTQFVEKEKWTAIKQNECFDIRSRVGFPIADGERQLGGARSCQFHESLKKRMEFA